MPPEPNPPDAPTPVPPQQPPASAPPAGLSLDPESLKRFADDEVSRIAETEGVQGVFPAAELEAWADERRKFLRERLRLLNQSLSEDINARRRYAIAIFILIVFWLVAILAILLLHGFLSKRDIAVYFPLWRSIFKTAIHFDLPESVLLALIGGTTATVIGLFAIVANYLYPKKPN